MKKKPKNKHPIIYNNKNMDAKQKNWRDKLKEIYEELLLLNPTYKEITEYSEGADYGELTFCKRNDNPLVIRLHDTWGIKRGGRLHIDIISGEFHLMLDKNQAPIFLNFIKEIKDMKRDIEKIKNSSRRF